MPDCEDYKSKISHLRTCFLGSHPRLKNGMFCPDVSTSTHPGCGAAMSPVDMARRLAIVSVRSFVLPLVPSPVSIYVAHDHLIFSLLVEPRSMHD